MSDPKVIMCPILTAEVMRNVMDEVITMEDRQDVVEGFSKNDERWIIPCKRDCGMWNKCHGINMKE